MKIILTVFLLNLFCFSSQLWSVEYSDSCGKEWEWRNPLPHGNTLRDLSWSEQQKQYVAVGDSGNIFSSLDGLNWQTQVADTNESMQAIHWNGLQWLAVGGNWDSVATIALSTDGVNWEVESLNSFEELNDVAWNGQQWIAVGSEGTILSSTDGKEWNKLTSNTEDDLHAIVWNGKQWLAVGGTVGFDYEQFYLYSESSVILSSDDGITWNQLAIETNEYLNDISWNGLVWAAVGHNGTILISDNGVDWVAQQSGINEEIFAISWNGQQWIAVGDYGSLVVSSDNINWQSEWIPTEQTLYSIQWNGKQWITGGYAGTLVYKTDHSDWKLFSNGFTHHLNSIAYDGNQMVAAGDSGTLLSSTDGFNWTLHTTGDSSTFEKIKWNGKQWIVIGWDGLIYASRDAKSWIKQKSGTTSALYDIDWNGNLWLVVGSDGIILTSYDGINWSQKIINANYNFNAVVWNGDSWLAIADGLFWDQEYGYFDSTPTIFYRSSDGINWEKQTTNISENFNDLAWNGNEWVAVGYQIIYSSQDGINWQAKVSEGNFNLFNISWNGHKWIATGDEIMLSSSDAKQWQQIWSGEPIIYDVLTIGEQDLLAVGSGGTLIARTCNKDINFQNTHAIIVAGGGNPDDPLWEATNTNANLAYNTLRYRGIDKNNILYFNAQTNQDVDNDGNSTNDIYAKPSSSKIKDSILSWAKNHVDSSTPLLLYLVDHGTDDIFYVDKPTSGTTDIFRASDLANWLNNLQEDTKARVTTIYDACNSGSFMQDLAVPMDSTYERINIFSAKPEQAAYFGASGRVSFSNFFWIETMKGHNVREAFRAAQVAVRTTTGNENNEYQSVIMDDNGDGVYDTKFDGSLAKDTHLGIQANTAAVFPEIYQTQGEISLSAGDTTTIFAKVDLPESLIERTWAVIIPPDSPVTGSTPITLLDEVELIYNPDTDQYEGTLSGLYTNGRYILSYFTQSHVGRTSAPVAVFATIKDGDTSSCNTETARISLKEMILHIGVVDYQPVLGDATVLYDVGLQYRHGTYPYLFELAYTDQSNGYTDCSDSRASYFAATESLQIPSLRISDTGETDIIWDNLSFKMIYDGKIGFEFIDATPR